MKILYKLVLVFIVAVIGLACGTTASTEALVATPDEAVNEAPIFTAVSADFASLSFKIDGVPAVGIEPGVMIIYVPSKKEVNIRANTAKGLLSIIIDDVDGPGTYTIKGNSKNGAGITMKNKMYEVKKSGTPFTVTISAVEEITAIKAPNAKAIRGTFRGKLKDDEGNTLEITEGKFSSQ